MAPSVIERHEAWAPNPAPCAVGQRVLFHPGLEADRWRRPRTCGGGGPSVLHQGSCNSGQVEHRRTRYHKDKGGTPGAVDILLSQPDATKGQTLRRLAE